MDYNGSPAYREYNSNKLTLKVDEIVPLTTHFMWENAFLGKYLL